MSTTPVNTEALLQVLQALNGHGHHIRELQATRSIASLTGSPNPIDVLIKDYRQSLVPVEAVQAAPDSRASVPAGAEATAYRHCHKCGYKSETVVVARAAPQQVAQPIVYTPGEWFDATTVDLMQAFFESRLPAIREAAKEHGYAIGLHGSMRRDLDLIAAPWREGAADPDTLAHAIAMAACGITRAGAYEWEKKPAGRVATCLPICWTNRHGVLSDGHIDLSVMPAQAAQNTPASALAIEALEAAKNGLNWYRQEYPEQVNGSDDEADQLIERAITALSATAGDPT